MTDKIVNLQKIYAKSRPTDIIFVIESFQSHSSYTFNFRLNERDSQIKDSYDI